VIDWCYYCKKRLFSMLIDLRNKHGLNNVIDGSNHDDTNDFRPGSRALLELGIRSPLQEAGLTKTDIRFLSRKLNLPTHNKPSSPCLATRFPYGMPITEEGLLRVNSAELFLAKYKINPLRVRDYGNTARIEVPKEKITLFLDRNMVNDIIKHFKTLGYSYISLDLEGYRTGSLNEPHLAKLNRRSRLGERKNKETS